MSKLLRFKGQTVKKASKSKKKKQEVVEESLENWVLVQDLEMIKGPLCIQFQETEEWEGIENIKYLNAIQGMGRVSFKDPSTVSVVANPQADEIQGIAEEEQAIGRSSPWAATQVFLAHPLGGGKFTLKRYWHLLAFILAVSTNIWNATRSEM
jgi:hypothetical protein